VSVFIADGSGQGSFPFQVRFPPGVINSESTVFASICEMATIAGSPFPFPWFGAAGLRVDNVVPRDTDDVVCMVEVLHDKPINFRVHFLVNP
jgi:hypothetical protein